MIKRKSLKAITAKNFDRRLSCPKCSALFPKKVSHARLGCTPCGYQWSAINGDPR